MQKLLLSFAMVLIAYCSLAQLKPSERIQEVKLTEETNQVQLFERVEQTQNELRGIQEFAEFQLNLKTLNSLQRADGNGLVEFSVPSLRNQTIAVQLVEIDLYDGDFIYAMPSNEKQQVNIGKHYRGIVKGEEKSLVSFSVFEDNVVGMIARDGKDNLIIRQLNHSAHHISYEENQLESKPAQCKTVDDGIQYTMEEISEPKNARSASNKCIKMHMEVDFDIYKAKQSSIQKTTEFVTAIMNQVATLYANEDIPVKMTPFNIWTEQSPYSGGPSDVLSQFGKRFDPTKGDIGQFISLRGSNGVAYRGGLCLENKNYRVAYAGIDNYYKVYPNYSKTVLIITHEFGHVLGSRHTHACVWNGNGTALDSCPGFTEGGCPKPGGPEGGKGTIMGYCAMAGYDVDFTLGFGPQPGNVIRNKFAEASCLTSCTGNDDGDKTPPSIPTSLVASNITKTSFSLNWVKSTDNVAVKGYEVLVDDKVFLSSSNSFDVSELEPSTSYNIKVRAFDAAGNQSSFSESIQVKTLPEDDQQCEEEQIKIELTTDRYGSETSWAVYEKGTDKKVFEGKGYKANETISVSKCLEKNKCYRFEILDQYGDGICCQYGQGSFNVFVGGQLIIDGSNFGAKAEKEFCIGKAEDNEPPTAPELKTTEVTKTSVTLEWTEAKDNVAVAGYVLYQNNELIQSLETTSFKVEKLKPDTKYRFSVKAIDTNNNFSKASNRVEVKTKNQSTSCEENTIIVTINTDKYGQETTWELKDNQGKVIANGNGYGENQTYTKDICVDYGCFEFTIFDAYKDGMCCRFGDGSYTVTVNDRIVAKGGEFGESEVKKFCIGDSEPDDPTPTQYCSLKGKRADQEWIDKVIINDMTNQSGKNNGYADFTSKKATLTIGSENKITATPDFSGSAYREYWYLWVDFDQNGEFASDELVASGSGQGRNETTAPFTVPASAKTGETRMRVAMKASQSTDACGEFQYGEVEDYTAVVQASAATRSVDSESFITAIYPNPAIVGSEIVLNFNEQNAKSVSVLNSYGQVVYSQEISKNQTSISTSQLQAGTYFIEVSNGEKTESRLVILF